MTGFRILLIVILTAIVAYTVVVILNHGLGLFAVFFGDIARMAWPGQFNLDFLGFLILSGFWLAWRHHFSPGGLALGVLGVLGGAPVLTLYLLIVSVQSKGNVAVMLLGERRADAASGAGRNPERP